MKDRKILEKNLTQNINKIKTKKKLVKEIKDELAKYDILHGNTQGYIGNADREIPKLDARVLYLLTDAVYRIAHQQLGEDALSIVPSDYFTEHEIKESIRYNENLSRVNEIEFPIVVQEMTMISYDAFIGKVHIKEIKNWLDNQVLFYDYEIQRESKQIIKDNQIILEATVNKQNVKEISEHIQNNTLEHTLLIFNATPRSSDEGEELKYNHKNMELSITKGTKIGIVDGYHRCLGIQNALEMNNEIDFSFPVLITNYAVKRAKRFQSQLAKATPIAKSRIAELEARRYSDTVIQQLKIESDLKGRIKTSKDNRIGINDFELVSYDLLADIIDEEFKMSTNADALDVADFLSVFFNYLIGTFKTYFIEEVAETRKEFIVNNNNMFIAYVIIARKLQENNINYRKIKDIVNSIDWSRDNPLWEEQGILSNRSFTDVNKARKNIKEYFRKLDIKEILEEGVTNGQ